jgi:hypothetical protein
MRSLRLALVLTVLALGFQACGDDTDSSHSEATVLDTSTPPFSAFDLQRREFAIVYDADVEGYRGDVLWRQSDGAERWDMFYAAPRNQQLGGASTLLLTGVPEGSCQWEFREDGSVELHCTEGELAIHSSELFHEGLLALQSDFEYEGEREYDGRGTSCFRTSDSVALKGFARICLTPDGLPLYLTISFGPWGPAEMTATDILGTPVRDEITQLAWDPARGFLPPVVPRTEVRFPPIPSLIGYLNDGVAPNFGQ